MTEHPTDLLEAYALHLLSSEMAAEVARHIEACAECRSEISDLERTLALLAYAAPPQMPPSAAEDRLFASIDQARRRELRDENTVGVSEQSTPATNGAREEAPMQPSIGHEQPARRLAHGGPRQWTTWTNRTNWTNWTNWHNRKNIVSALGTLAAVLLLAVGLLSINLHAEQSHADALAAQVRAQQSTVRAQQTALAVFTKPGAVVRRLTATSDQLAGATVTMAMDLHQGTGVLVTSDLPALSEGKTYEFWLVQATGNGGDAQVIPKGTFTVDATGGAVHSFLFTTDLPVGSLHDAGISIEKAGGVVTPDSPMLMLLSA